MTYNVSSGTLSLYTTTTLNRLYIIVRYYYHHLCANRHETGNTSKLYNKE